MIKEYYLSILSGQQRGFAAALFKSALSAFTFPYLAVLNTRNILYQNGIVRRKRLPVKVISIGNITTGGTGKTPLVEFLAKYLLKTNKKVAILSRGYGGNNPSWASEDKSGRNIDYVNDECLILRENLEDVPVMIGSDRAKSGERAIMDHGVDCLILDDGFQHIRLERDLDIVVIDSLNPFGGEHLVPRGRLREPLKNLGRADLFIISHGDQSGEHSMKSLHARLRQINPDIPVCESRHKPVYLENVTDGSILEPDWLRDKRAYALSAIGNPDSFALTLKGLGADLIKHRIFRDHHNYTQSEIDLVISETQSLGAEAIVVTQKDMVKIRNMHIKEAKILSLKIEIQITKGMGLLKEAIDRVLQS